MVDNGLAAHIESRFQQLCVEAGRQGVIGFAPVKAVRLLPEQAQYLRHKLKPLGSTGDITAVSLGLLYREDEIQAVPSLWKSRPSDDDRWNDYARAYWELNRLLNRFTRVLAAEFGAIAEQATVEGWVQTVQHVTDYFPHCVSHRAFAEVASVGWRGRHGLIVTPEAGPALRLATVFVSGSIPPQSRELPGCGDCCACLEVCPILCEVSDYREACRRRLGALGLEEEVCGICVRVCRERVRELRSTPG